MSMKMIRYEIINEFNLIPRESTKRIINRIIHRTLIAAFNDFEPILNSCLSPDKRFERYRELKMKWGVQQKML